MKRILGWIVAIALALPCAASAQWGGLYNYKAGGGLTIGNPVVSGAANSVLFQDSSQNLATSTNFLYSESSGPRLQVGSGSGTSQGWIIGYQQNTFGGIWATSVTPTSTNYTLAESGGVTALNSNTASGSVGLYITGTAKLTIAGTAGAGPSITAGTATTDVAALSVTRTNNNAAVATGVNFTFTDTTSAAGFLPLSILGGSAGTTNLFSLGKTGAGTFGASVGAGTTGKLFREDSGGHGTFILTNTTGDVALVSLTNGSGKGAITVPSDGVLGFASGTANAYDTFDTALYRGGANQIIAAGKQSTGSGAATSRAEINKAVTAIANNTATDLATVTVPNGAHSAGGKFTIKCSAGAGGAIGANEFTAINEYDFVVARTAGVNAVATLSAALLTTTTASVAGGATPTLAGSLSAISGAVGATNTFTIKATVNALTGSSTNHTCFLYGTLLNDNASGVTIL